MSKNHLFYMMGKSASGKDTVYEELLKDPELGLRPLVPWTTRPIRDGEKDGEEYHFTGQEGFRKLQEAGKVVEYRTYDTVYGPWIYFTVDDGTMDREPEKDKAGKGREGTARQDKGAAGQVRTIQDVACGDSCGRQKEGEAEPRGILGIGTLESYVKIRDYFGRDRVIPVYIEVDDGLRLERALKREKKPGNHKYEEMCRRFLADQKDFSEENLKKAGIVRRFRNDDDRSICIAEVRDFILGFRSDV